jgi:DNA-binding NarL/FixJ family response regulator
VTDLTSVVLADDHPPTRTGVRAALESHGFRVVAEAEDAAGAIEAAAVHRPAICVLDLFMPGQGINACRRIRAELPATKIVVLTVSEEDTDLFEALRAGADGYLLKTMSADRLAQALRGVLQGEAAMPRKLVTRVIEEFRVRPQRLRPYRVGMRGHPVIAQLSERELDVVELLLRGMTTSAVARELRISEVTVRRHVSSVVRKAGAADRRTALAALRRGIDAPPPA